MVNQKLELSPQTPAGNSREIFLLKRIEEEPIEISNQERLQIIDALQNGERFIQVGKYTIMVNSIRSIDPKYGQKNIPPRPKPMQDFNTETGNYYFKNQKDIDRWDKLFGKEGE